ncbi:MAG: undecaprenyldiphospho-muramoylpentapeptide beta-N-acetylglucosaminyltransferase [Dysgonamonadaceae bacterium]|jgi:UDP-N-acetylglucosamine--N-acetylmuramyl-(pentapeptide) pyrophosphoryl-undecaprenol N-acetylglucosamine transferase|nr:undecaprenyldiphospho-muramoylpentapeptide beta-N-acetylglucosaminyltransferase [Dysgonamonadaceae bacterium]
MKYIISGGGTGGHIFPAIAIANGISKRFPDAEILFVGAQGRMEMRKVPAAGYNIEGLPVAGFDRKNLLRNISVLAKLCRSLFLAWKIIRNFKPDVVIGVGGYASGPILKAANRMKIPTVLQEQNSYAGVTNKLLAKNATRICVAYEGMDQFFPAEKIVLTGNPVRKDLHAAHEKRTEAIAYFKLNPAKKTVLVLGGSLGARTINQSMMRYLDEIAAKQVQFIWQTGEYYYREALASIRERVNLPVYMTDFISRMDMAYAVADLIVSRAGAGTISELCIVGKPVILVPSPNVAENHQMKNACALVEKDAAVLLADAEAPEQLIPAIFQLIEDENRMKELGENILKMALPDATDRIVDEIIKIAQKQ